ncbi:molybdate ABC transporter substrate-binding protein [Pseudazoarcus pumilus]|uniref:Molybdate ABC transporter substrate-binding protein n=2 Tax=Pseudazoarcus pumilus TaxID=2067960 RepID=A0A2I6SB60_9RHOO|nr:molybdate ABC transporter substrate-binding protein [Pseudazoarcus pumilus]
MASCLYSAAASAQATPEANLYAAGSLRGVLTEVSKSFADTTGKPVSTTFGPSGLLRGRIEKGEPAQVFASANMKHPRTLADAGGWSQPEVFTRNNLCALAQPEVKVSSANLLDVMLDADIKLGTSTPKADPSGDYAWALFEKAEKVRAGSFKALDAKALKLTGGPDSAKAPEGRNPYAWVMDEGKADVFLTYCTNAVAAKKDLAKLQIIEIPAELSVGATYGMSVRDGAPEAARALADYIRSSTAQEVFRKYGFGAI